MDSGREVVMRSTAAGPVGRQRLGQKSGAQQQLRHREPALFISLAFALFVFVIPFEDLDIGTEASFSLARIAGYLFFLCALLQPHISFRRPPAVFWLFALSVLILLIWIPYQPTYFHRMAFGEVVMLVQMLVFLWLASNLLQYERVSKLILRTLAVSCWLLAVWSFFEIGATKLTSRGLGLSRVSAVEQDPNIFASVLVLGLLAMLGLAYGRAQSPRSPDRSRLLVWFFYPTVALAIVRSGSRGGLVALAAGVLVLLLRRGTPRSRIRNVVAVLAIFSVLVALNLTSESSRHRWGQTLREGSMAGREQIFPVSWHTFLDSPIVGWGAVTNYYEVGRRLGQTARDTHNLYLWVLTEEGVVGGIPYFLALGGCVLAAWRARKGPLGVLPLALLSSVLVINMSLTWHNRKLHWLVLALSLASSAQLLKRPVRIAKTKPRGVRIVGGPRWVPAAKPAFGVRQSGSRVR